MEAECSDSGGHTEQDDPEMDVDASSLNLDKDNASVSHVRVKHRGLPTSSLDGIYFNTPPTDRRGSCAAKVQEERQKAQKSPATKSRNPGYDIVFERSRMFSFSFLDLADRQLVTRTGVTIIRRGTVFLISDSRVLIDWTAASYAKACVGCY